MYLGSYLSFAQKIKRAVYIQRALSVHIPILEYLIWVPFFLLVYLHWSGYFEVFSQNQTA